MALFGAIGCYLRDRFLGQQCGTETESTTMFEAIDSGDARTVSMLLDARPTLLEKKVSTGGVYVHRLCSSDELTPLMYAARADELGLVKLLLRRGAKINAESFFSQTALHFAAESGHAGVVAYLLYSGAQPRNHSPTPLMYASMKGHGRVVPLLLEHMGGQGLETRDGYGFTALHWAARQGHVEVVVHLLRHGAQADTRDNKGGTALSIAVSRGHVEAVKLLVGQLGPHALEERDQRGKSLLHVAVKCVKEDMMAYLLDNGLRPTTTDNNGMTGLMCGAQSTRAWVIPKLIKYTGRDGLDMRDATEGRTALHWAVYSGRAESVRALLAAGADTSIVDNQGRTPRSYTEKGYFLDSASAFKVSVHADSGVLMTSFPIHDIHRRYEARSCSPRDAGLSLSYPV
jgi:ankyrin repeat protein